MRQSRLKTEQDVFKLHTRIHLLLTQEEKALKIIKETREKAIKIVQIRQENEEFQQKLQTVKEQSARKRNPSIFQSSVTSETIATARSKVEEKLEEK